MAHIDPVPAGLTWTLTYDPSAPPKWVEAKMTAWPASMMSGRFKLKAVTWDEYGRSDQATSYQE